MALLLPALAIVLFAIQAVLDTHSSEALASSSLSELRIGYQKGGPLLILKTGGQLERRLSPMGIRVRWAEFPSGPPLLEALNSGAIDLGVAGNAATAYALAAPDSELVYLAVEVPSPRGEALLVPAHSQLRSLADLKGKTVAFTRGSNAEYFLMQALAKAHLSLGDIRQAYLSPTDARAAFESGSIDAWVIWDPFYAEAELNAGARELTDGTGLVDDMVFYLSTRPTAEQHALVLKIVVEEIEKTDEWMRNHSHEAAQRLADATGLPSNICQTAILRHNYGVRVVDQSVVNSQQRIADSFYAAGILPFKEDAARAMLCNSSSTGDIQVLCRRDIEDPLH